MPLSGIEQYWVEKGKAVIRSENGTENKNGKTEDGNGNRA